MKTFIKKLLRESLLLVEKDNRSIIVNKLGLDQETADLAHNLSNKYSIWIANQAKDYYPGHPKQFIIANEDKINNILNLFKTQNKPKTNIKELDFGKAWTLYNTYNYIKDWVESPNTPKINLTQYTWDEAENKATEWHDSLEQGDQIENIDKNSETIYSFDDGFYWALTKDSYCSASEESMGHCASATNEGMYLMHLRRNNEEFITADWDPNDKFVIQLKGKKNSKPKEMYHKYITWFLVDSGMVDELRTTEGYKPETNFKLTDLSENGLRYYLKNGSHLFDRANISDLIDEYDDSDKLLKIMKDYPMLNDGKITDFILISKDLEKTFKTLGERGEEYISNLHQNNAGILLLKTTEPEKMMGILGEKAENYLIELVSTGNLDLRLMNSKNPKKIVDIILSDKKFFSDLNTSAINGIVTYGSDKNKIYDLILTNKELIKKLESETIDRLMVSADEPKDFINTLGDVGLDYIRKKTPHGLHLLVNNYKTNVEKIINIFLNSKTFLSKLNANGIEDLILNKTKEKASIVFKLFLDKINLIPNLTHKEVGSILRIAKNLEIEGLSESKVADKLVNNKSLMGDIDFNTVIEILPHVSKPINFIDTLLNGKEKTFEVNYKTIERIIFTLYNRKVKLTDDEVINLFELLIRNKDFISNLNPKNEFTAIKLNNLINPFEYRGNTEEIIDLFLNSKTVLNNIKSENLSNLIKYTKNPKKITDTILKNDKLISSVTSTAISNMLYQTKENEKERIINSLISNETFLSRINQSLLYSLLYYSVNPTNTINKLLSSKEFMSNLTQRSIEDMLEKTEEPEKVKAILKKYGHEV